MHRSLLLIALLLPGCNFYGDDAPDAPPDAGIPVSIDAAIAQSLHLRWHVTVEGAASICMADWHVIPVIDGAAVERFVPCYLQELTLELEPGLHTVGLSVYEAVEVGMVLIAVADPIVMTADVDIGVEVARGRLRAQWLGHDATGQPACMPGLALLIQTEDATGNPVDLVSVPGCHVGEINTVQVAAPLGDYRARMVLVDASGVVLRTAPWRDVSVRTGGDHADLGVMVVVLPPQ
jgi:hypothetical protein